jgi:hypothetical protein
MLTEASLKKCLKQLAFLRKRPVIGGIRSKGNRKNFAGIPSPMVIVILSSH